MAAICLAVVLISTATADSRTVQLWNYNVTLDGIGENVTFQPMAVSSDTNNIVRSIRFQGESNLDWGAIYLYDHRATTAVILEDLLRQTMIGSCKAIRADPGMVGNRTGMVAKADARVEHGFGQTCWGGAVMITGGNVGVTRYFVILAHFQNETLNEHLVKTAQIGHQ